MQRRQAGSSNSKAGTSRNGGGASSGDSSPAVIKNVPQNAAVVGTPSRTTNIPLTGNNNSISSYWLLLLAFLLTVANYQISAPPKVQQVEHDILQGAREAEHVLEQEMRDWWGNNNNNKREPPSNNNNQNTAEQQRRTASQRMAAQQQQQAGDSQQHSWVEGEKRLKRELQKLVALQQQGQELGVPVLTRWLGEDIPAWAGTGVDRDAWQAQVQERYQEMRLDEERWRDRVAATLQQQAEKRG